MVFWYFMICCGIFVVLEWYWNGMFRYFSGTEQNVFGISRYWQVCFCPLLYYNFQNLYTGVSRLKNL